ncbi:hypothetical protein CGRA01v4_13618 [Colletotrichum graminicola]|nr:hypothetical protein CGRA01v4_13618 [Colletotrichum graminicola]
MSCVEETVRLIHRLGNLPRHSRPSPLKTFPPGPATYPLGKEMG